MEEINKKQVQNLFVKLDSLEESPSKQDIFSQVGKDCYGCRNIDKWIETFDNDIEKMISWIATGDSPYWESLQWEEGKKSLYLTGREGENCACEYNTKEQPLVSLCNYCCKKFQEVLWGDLLQKEVSVEITEGINLGGKRCSTRIRIKDKDL